MCKNQTCDKGVAGDLGQRPYSRSNTLAPGLQDASWFHSGFWRVWSQKHLKGDFSRI